jgi:hypothetical protein
MLSTLNVTPGGRKAAKENGKVCDQLMPLWPSVGSVENENSPSREHRPSGGFLKGDVGEFFF